MNVVKYTIKEYSEKKGCSISHARLTLNKIAIKKTSKRVKSKTPHSEFNNKRIIVAVYYVKEDG